MYKSFNKMCCCMYGVVVLFQVSYMYPQVTTTHCNKMCCCMVLWVLFRVGYPQQHILTKCVVVWCCGCCFPQHHTTTHFGKMCCCGYSKQHHNTIQQHILLKCVDCCCGTRNHTHNTIQQHTLLMT